MRMASSRRRTYGICSLRSGGISARLALYSANSSLAERRSRALEHRRHIVGLVASWRSFRSMLLKM